ncbi:MAG: FecR domain-containing protein [Bacteroidota bacterium]
MSTDAYIELVYRNLKGELSPEEFNALNEMTGKDTELAHLRLDIEDAWDASGEEITLVTEDETKVLFEKITRNKSTDTKVFRLSRIIPAIAALFILALGAIWLIRGQTEVYTEEGLIRLSDNSMVELREGSRLEIVEMNNEFREARLSGEAYFDIESDAKRPFTIHVGNTTTVVVGTKFLLKESQNAVYIVMEEGEVLFSTMGPINNAVTLRTGEKGKTGENGQIQDVVYKNLMGWKDGFYPYKDQTLADVLEELGVIFNTTITVEKTQLLNCSISAILTADNINEILNQLARQLEMDVRQEGQNWILYGGKCN